MFSCAALIAVAVACCLNSATQDGKPNAAACLPGGGWAGLNTSREGPSRSTDVPYSKWVACSRRSLWILAALFWRYAAPASMVPGEAFLNSPSRIPLLCARQGPQPELRAQQQCLFYLPREPWPDHVRQDDSFAKPYLVTAIAEGTGRSSQAANCQASPDCN